MGMFGSRLGRWSWMFWKEDDEEEVLVYSPNSYSHGTRDYFVVVKFKLEGNDWWLCQFDHEAEGKDLLIRVNNYGRQLREAMTTCYAMNKLMGVC